MFVVLHDRLEFLDVVGAGPLTATIGRALGLDLDKIKAAVSIVNTVEHAAGAWAFHTQAQRTAHAQAAMTDEPRNGSEIRAGTSRAPETKVAPAPVARTPEAKTPVAPAPEAKTPVAPAPETETRNRTDDPRIVNLRRNAISTGERVVEPRVLALDEYRGFRPMSDKSAGFDAYKGARVVWATTETYRDGTSIVVEGISGGTWLQIKGQGEPRPDLIIGNVNNALNKAASALNSSTANQMQRTGPYTAWRTSYAGPPYNIIIHIELDQGLPADPALVQELYRAAEYALRENVHTPDLPPVRVVIR